MQLKSKKGFTLVELIVVIAVIAVLAVLAAVAFQNVRRNAEDAAIQADANRVRQHVDMWNSLAGGTGVTGTGSLPGTHTITVPGPLPTSPATEISLTIPNTARGTASVTAGAGAATWSTP